MIECASAAECFVPGWNWCWRIRASWQSTNGGGRFTESPRAHSELSCVTHILFQHQANPLSSKCIFTDLLSPSEPCCSCPQAYSFRTFAAFQRYASACASPTQRIREYSSNDLVSHRSQTINTQELICYAVPPERAVEITAFPELFCS